MSELKEAQEGYIDLKKLPTADNALIWYAAVLPFLSLFFHYYCTNKYHGMLLWGLTILLRIFACYWDNKRLIKLGMWKDNKITVEVFFPIMYMVKRNTWLKRSATVVVVAAACFVYAFISNGFVQNLIATDEKYCSYVSQYYSSYITNLPADDNLIYNDDETLDTLIKKHCYGKSYTGTIDKEVNYTHAKEGEVHYVIATAKLDGEELKLTFKLDYDGYVFLGMEIESVELGGKTLEGEERDTLLKEMFMYETSEE